MASVSISCITLDVSNLTRGSEFWSALLGVDVAHGYGGYVWLDKIAPGIRLVLQEVSEPHVVKNRMHLDLTSPDPEDLIRRVMELGGGRLDDVDDPAYSLTVMSDPDGNEFCVGRRLSPTVAADAAVP